MLEFFSYDEALRSDWDRFVENHPLGSIHQIAAWKDLQKQIPGRQTVLGFGVKKDNEIVGVTWCVQMQTGRLGKFWFYSARGPVCDNPEITQFLLKNIAEQLKKSGAIFWRLDPYWSDDTWAQLPTTNYQLPTQQYQPTDTLLIDLTPKEEDILAQMKQRGRRGIKTAIKAGVEIETIKSLSQGDLNDWWSLNQDTTGRDGFSGHEKSYYQKFLKTLTPQAVLFFATYKNQRIAAAISTFYADKAIYYFGASTSDRDLNKLKAPTLLQWAMIKYAKAQGCTTYDFLGIAPEDQPNHPYAGITQFKNGFGGYRQTFSPGREVVLDKFWYAIYKIIKKLKK